ncbi:(Fe-S)-binding protein [Actinocrinis puniceicyclus]|uniref:(Fe-S)-binding protein n=1 Tax=Actinocrinis puniceicyclus TaxID=977794 RepID=A0A8J7WJ25_9ACTN|nr:(Fe-S)-binding protein [Actinocrinis puniceicyclus]MBS2963146.1 (Fe-S)-binding protein [Actinocrinis puniceicyclus]
MRVALFITCLNDALFPEAGKATVTLLERLGVTVDFPDAQTCCGQMHYNTGYRADAEPLARAFAAAFAGYEYVVAPSGSCAAMVRDVHPMIVPDVAVPPVYELSEFLTDVLGVQDVGAYFPHTVAYHPTCHSLRLLKVGDRPLRLLRAVAGLELARLPGEQECCGFGGTFSVKNPDVSTAMGADKVANAVRSGADYLVAADNSCLMHISGLAQRSGAPIRTIHLAEVLAATRGD